MIDPTTPLSRKRTWVKLGRIEPNGHWLFRLYLAPEIPEYPRDLGYGVEQPGVYIADNSGPTPDRTDDAPLRIDTTRAMDNDAANITLWSVPVIAEENPPREWWVAVGATGAVRVLQACPDLAVHYCADLADLAVLCDLATDPGDDRLASRRRVAERNLLARF